MMTLHLDEQNFKSLITLASQNSNISADIIEKDYYVTLMLEELSQKQEEIDAYFKGGTCLYKIYAPMQRFSEDIDITVCSKGISTSKTKRNLENVSKKYVSLEKDENDPNNENKKGSITQVFNYKSSFDVPDDPLQRYEKVKIEATSFTVSEPYEENLIHPLLIDLLPEGLQDKVKQRYEIEDFAIKNITLERIWCDKLLAAEFYTERQQYFDVAKHVYDIINMTHMPRIQRLLASEDDFISNLAYKRIEETKRIGSDLWNKPLYSLSLYDCIHSDVFKQEYANMQQKYVFDEKYIIPIEDIIKEMEALQNLFDKYGNKEYAFLNSEVFISKIKEYNADFQNESSVQSLDKNYNEIFETDQDYNEDYDDGFDPAEE